MQCISVQTLISHLTVDFVRPKTLRSGLWRCPILTRAIRWLEDVTKVANQKTVKIVFHFLRFLLSFFNSSSAFMRALPSTKYPRTPVKFSWQVPFELSF